VEEGVMRVLDPSAETLRKLAATTAIPEGQRTIVSDALPAAQEREKLLSQASDIAAKASRLRQALERKRESLKSLPQVSGSYPTLDRMLADILKAEEEVEALVEKEAAVQEQAAAQADKVAEALSAMPSP
jgi:septal ring factor EnvC (AmiA/AmiB activator)